MDRPKFNEYEVHPVIEYEQGHFETTDEDDPNIAYWSVYGHLPEGGIDCIADCIYRKDAELLQEALRSKLKSDA